MTVLRRVSRAAARGVAVAVCACFASGLTTDDAEDEPVDLQVGDEAPAFSGVDQSGEEWSSEEHVGNGYVVVYFFPAALTGG